ncbi:MAG: helix-turn-helix domain-containing protein [Patescibacteria group bacterium]|nr:winged helix-turn-helix transcriptional regulator [Patescibacteria group bacterium]
MPTVNSVLKQLELNDKEIKVYLALIQSGPSSVQNISRVTSISRSTVYQRIENLKKAGLVIFEFGDKGQVVRAIHPDKLKEIIEKRVEESKKLSAEFDSILPELANIYQPTSTKAKILHFEGKDGIQRMIYDYEMEAKSRNLYGYTTIMLDKITGKEFNRKYHKKFYKKGYKDHFLMSDSKGSRAYFTEVKSYWLYKEGRIFVRKLPQSIFNPKVNVSIYDDKYSIALIKKGKPFGVIIQNEEIAQHQLEIFKILWNQSEEI